MESSQSKQVSGTALIRTSHLDGDTFGNPSVIGPDKKQTLFKKKAREVLDACRSRDVSGLRALAESPGGFLSDDLRRLAWPTLLGIPSDIQENNGDAEQEDQEDTGDWKDLPRHRDEEQVQLDVHRSFVYYPNDKTDAHLDQCRSELSSLIVEVLRRHPYLCYFQGFHDICQVFLLVLQPTRRAPLVARLSVLRIRDFMLPTLGPTTAQLRLLPDLLGRADPRLRQHIAAIEPFYALAGTLTLYAHNIEAYHDIARLFDVFLSNEPAFTIYVFAQIVINRREEILDIDEPDMLQVVLAKVPPNMDLDALVSDAVVLYERFPPRRLRSWRQISEFSCLKTARLAEDCTRQTLQEGHAFFEQQVQQVRWAEMRERMSTTLWRYRRPIKAIGMSFAVAIVAFYMRRNPFALHHIISLFRQPSDSKNKPS